MERDFACEDAGLSISAHPRPVISASLTERSPHLSFPRKQKPEKRILREQFIYLPPDKEEKRGY